MLIQVDLAPPHRPVHVSGGAAAVAQLQQGPATDLTITKHHHISRVCINCACPIGYTRNDFYAFLNV